MDNEVKSLMRRARLGMRRQQKATDDAEVSQKDINGEGRWMERGEAAEVQS